MGKKCCIVSVVLVACVVVGLAVGIPLGLKKASEIVTVAAAPDNGIATACQATSYPATCNQTFSGSNYTRSSMGVTKYSVTAASTGINNTLASVLGVNTTDELIAAAVEVCLETLGLSLEQLDTALATLNNSTSASILETTLIKDIQAWVSSAMELHTTCIDTFLEVNITLGTSLQTNSSHTNELLSNALAFLASFEAYGDDLQSWKAAGFSLPGNFSLSDLTKGIHFPNLTGLGHRKLLSSQLPEENNGLPSWVDAKVQRHLLQAASNSSYDVVVAKDGSGNYTTIQAAANAAPQKSTKRYIIYIKAGTYAEQVNVSKHFMNLVFLGDGMNQTIITGSLHVANSTNMTTFKSATLIVEASGFIGKFFRIENTAGSFGQQAVALRVTADKVAFYQCTIDGWQDTLYANTLRQFYRECDVLGTVDFIFGNAQAVFQSCNIIAKKTTWFGQTNTYTAQGRTDPHANTGLSFQNCTFDGTDELKANTTFYKTYLGRPWKAYATCIIMESNLLGHIDPTGWLPWNTSSFGLNTSYLAEYQNYGAGSNTTARVSWSHQITDKTTANKYQASSFIQASSWVPSYNISVALTL